MVKTNKKMPNWLKILIIVILSLGLICGAIGVGLIASVVHDVPDIDYTKVATSLNESSVILDENDKLVEKIQTLEFRTVVEMNKVPEITRNAFIAVEDERFKSHNGIDVKRIFGALAADLKAGKAVQGASTITQQLIKNLYLSEEVDRNNLVNDIKRKIREMYLAIEMEKHLSKDQILLAYLNTVNLGQGAYGVQEASRTFFDKDVNELNAVESAMIAAIPKSPSKYPPYILLNPLDVDPTKHFVINNVTINGSEYAAVYNENNWERAKIVLSTMRKNNYISESEYREALNTDYKSLIKSNNKTNTDLETSYFNDYVKKQVIEDLVKEKGISREDAVNLLHKGGLTIYSTIDIGMQSEIESIYSQFTDLMLASQGTKRKNIKGAALVEREIANNNIVDSTNKIVYYEKAQLYDDLDNLKIEKGTYGFEPSGNLWISNSKINYKNFDITGFYEVDDGKNLITFNPGYLKKTTIAVGSGSIEALTSDRDNKRVVISSYYINKNDDFYSIDGNGTLLINPKYFYVPSQGVVQPQSSVVIIDYASGKIRALVGGRDQTGQMLYNRATDSARQPGSSMKPISTYLPALDNGYTAATPIDDIPHYTASGALWPQNWYGKNTSDKSDDYRGLNTLRVSVEQSINVNAVKVVEDIGYAKSVSYLEKLGIIDSANPNNDTFVTSAESKATNDENSASLALGGMTKGISPLRMTAAYGAIANQGKYVEPIAYTKVLDRNGKVLLEKTPKINEVVSPQVSYLMTDILKGVVTRGTGRAASIYSGNSKIPVAGKTGTTQNNSDAWFIGYTPYYVAGIWIGNDSPAIKLSNGSTLAANLWKNVMKKVHTDLKAKDFQAPEGMVRVSVCSQSGKLPSDLCGRDSRGSTVYSELFVKGTAPKEHCDIHVSANIDITNNKLATELTPLELIESRVFIKRTPEYSPEKHQGFIPKDFMYTLPTLSSDTDYKLITPPAVEVELNEDGTPTTEVPKTETEDSDINSWLAPESETIENEVPNKTE